MPDAVIVAAARSITQALTDNAWPQPITFERRYLARRDYKELSETRGDVVALTDKSHQLTRAKRQHDPTIVVAVRRQVSPSDLDSIDQLVFLCERLFAFLDEHRHHAATTIADLQHDPLFVVEELREGSQFCSLLQLRLLAVR